MKPEQCCRNSPVSVSVLTVVSLVLFLYGWVAVPLAESAGALRKNPANLRYFTDDSGKSIYLTGSHTWGNFQDNGTSDPPPTFNYSAYLDWLQARNHNFFRLWSWEESKWTNEIASGYYIQPNIYIRTGSSTALDGKPKFNLTQFNQGYFDRLRQRIVLAGQKNIYVAIVLFNGWSVDHPKGNFGSNNPWKGHPYNSNNNINGVTGDFNGDSSGDETHTLVLPAITTLQKAYVEKVIDTVNDLDNVLYEISNESNSNSQDWQYAMILHIKSYEANKAKQHPIGMTVEWPNGSNGDLFNSPADWVSPNGDVNAPSTATGNKIVILDTDHVCGVCGDRSWVWKSFTRGNNPIFMDVYDGAAVGMGASGFNPNEPAFVSARLNMGYTRTYASKMNLNAMIPRPDLASTGYCLANPAASGAEYLVYFPSGGAATVNLSSAQGSLAVEWFNPASGSTLLGGSVAGGRVRTVTAPFSNDAVLYLKDNTETVPPDQPATLHSIFP